MPVLSIGNLVALFEYLSASGAGQKLAPYKNGVAASREVWHCMIASIEQRLTATTVQPFFLNAMHRRDALNSRWMRLPQRLERVLKRDALQVDQFMVCRTAGSV
jgi:hypothetical protein